MLQTISARWWREFPLLGCHPYLFISCEKEHSPHRDSTYHFKSLYLQGGSAIINGGVEVDARWNQGGTPMKHSTLPLTSGAHRLQCLVTVLPFIIDRQLPYPNIMECLSDVLCFSRFQAH